MAAEQFLVLYNTSENKLINRAYKDTVFKIDFIDPDMLDVITQDIGADLSSIKYHLIIIIDNVEVAVLKSSSGLFHIEQVIQDYTKTDSQGYANKFASHVMPQSRSGGDLYVTNPHPIHKIDKFACNKNNLIQVQFKIGLSYYSIDNDTFYPAEPKLVTGTKFVLSRYYFWNAVQQHDALGIEGIKDVTEFYPFILDSSSKRFLTNQEYDFKRKVRVADFQTLAFFNGKFCNSANQGHGHNSSPCFNSVVKYIYIKTFNANGNTLSVGRIENNEANGGTYFPALTSPNLIPPNWLPQDRGLLYVGVGPQNIIGSWQNITTGTTYVSQDFSNASSYEIWATGTGGENDIHSRKYQFEMQEDDCKGYETIRLAYLNRQGAWDYMNFTKKSTKSTEITRSNFKQNYGIEPITYPQAPNPVYNQWDYNYAMGGTKTYNVNAIQTIEANSDWLTEEDAIHLEELFTSPDTYMQQGGIFVPVVVTEKDYVKQTKANDKLIQYVIGVQKGHETRVQRL